jgi:hypothetical protein
MRRMLYLTVLALALAGGMVSIGGTVAPIGTVAQADNPSGNESHGGPTCGPACKNKDGEGSCFGC